MSEVTQILSAIEHGDTQAAEQLLPLVYEELRKLAARRLRHEKPGQTLQATALVHEAYARLVGHEASRDWDGRNHFFAAAAEAMRRILIEKVRHKASEKHGGGYHRQDFDEVEIVTEASTEDLLALDEAMHRLEAENPAKAEVVKLRYFAGLTIEETAAVLGISTATAKRHWVYARAWLYRAVEGNEPPAPL